MKSRILRLLSMAFACSALLLIFTIAGAAQAPRFTSLYTNLKTDCRAAIKLKKGEGLNGEDVPLKCKGYDGYEVRIDYSAASSNLRVQPLGDKSDEAISLGMQSINYDQTHKIEWRFANGKPFAVIYRIDKSKSDQPEEMWRPENKTGESLMVIGLKGFEHINFEVDAKTANANVKARETADAAYAKKP